MKAQEQEQGFSCLSFSKYWTNTPLLFDKYGIVFCAILTNSAGAGTENIQPIVVAQDIQRILHVPFEENGGVLGRF